MPAKHRNLPGDSRPVASRRFTDREDLIRVFQSAIASGRPGEVNVLVYYGVGGIGKTSLRRKLNRLLEDKSPRVVHAVLDFDVPGFRNEETALFALRKALHDEFKIQFPTFDIAYAVYWQKVHPQTALLKEQFPLVEESAILGDLVSLGGYLPIVGLVPRLPSIIAKGSKALRDWWTRRGRSDLHDLTSLEPTEIQNRLPSFWAGDLKDALARTGSPAVLFLDTYEALWERERSEAITLQRDAWIRELVALLPEVLWVICGREKLRWGEASSDWGGRLSQHLVGGLAETDAREFLGTCGVTDRGIQQAVIVGSRGVPYCLDLAVDTFLEISIRHKRDPTPSDFARTPNEMFSRFLRHLTQPETETLKVLSVPRFWDYRLFKALLTETQTGYPVTAFTDICRFSFMSPGAEPETWTMHPLMRQSLQERLAPELLQQIHKFMFDYHVRQLSELDSGKDAARQMATLTEAFHHGCKALDVVQLLDWFKKASAEPRQYPFWKALVPMSEEIVRLLEQSVGPEHPKLTGSLWDLALLYNFQGRSAEAERLLQRAISITEKQSGPHHPDIGRMLHSLAGIYGNQGKHVEAESLYKRLIDQAEAAPDKSGSLVSASLNNLALFYHRLGRDSEAEPLAVRLVEVLRTSCGPDHPRTAIALTTLARIREGIGKFREAESDFRLAIDVLEKTLGPEDGEVAGALERLVGLYRKMGRNEQAGSLAERAKCIRAKDKRWLRTLDG